MREFLILVPGALLASILLFGPFALWLASVWARYVPPFTLDHFYETAVICVFVGILVGYLAATPIRGKS